jgi:hypothetical protein
MSDLEKYVEQLEAAPIAEVRKAASTYKIKWTRDMTQEELIEAIKASLSSSKYALTAVGDVPQPGWARILVHSDPTPNAANRPVYVSVNNYAVLIPRDVEVDVPKKIVEALANSKSSKLKEDPSQPVNSPTRYRFVEVANYPFSLVSYIPGPDPRGEYERASAAAKRPRVAFRDKYGYWPKNDEELRDALRSGDLNITSIKEV